MQIFQKPRTSENGCFFSFYTRLHNYVAVFGSFGYDLNLIFFLYFYGYLILFDVLVL